MFIKICAYLAILATSLSCLGNQSAQAKIFQIALNKSTTMSAGICGQPVTSYYTRIDIGTPPKPFKVLIDINAKDSWVPHYLRLGALRICTRLNYKDGYSKKDSSTSKKEDKLYSIYYQKCQLSGKAYEDKFEFKNVTESVRFESIKQRFLAMSSASNDRFSDLPIDGVISLNPSIRSNETGTRSILLSLGREKLIDDLKFSLWLDTVQDSGQGGEITFGGSNSARYTGHFNYHSLVTIHDRWEMGLQSVMLGNNVVSCYQRGCTAVLSTGVNDLYGPQEDVRRILNLLGIAKPDKKTKNGAAEKDSCVDEIHEIECLDIVNIPPLTFNIDGKSYVVPPASYVKKKVGGIFSKTSCYVTIFQSETSNQWILGTNFLANFYTVFDFDNDQIGFAKLKA